MIDQTIFPLTGVMGMHKTYWQVTTEQQDDDVKK
jgi:hypothetical protein